MVDVIQTCRQCRSPRLARVYGHCSDMCRVELAGKHAHGYVPRDLGVGGGEAAHLRYCLDCGQIQGTFPMPPTAIEEGRGRGRILARIISGVNLQ